MQAGSIPPEDQQAQPPQATGDITSAQKLVKVRKTRFLFTHLNLQSITSKDNTKALERFLLAGQEIRQATQNLLAKDARDSVTLAWKNFRNRSRGRRLRTDFAESCSTPNACHSVLAISCACADTKAKT